MDIWRIKLWQISAETLCASEDEENNFDCHVVQYVTEQD